VPLNSKVRDFPLVLSSIILSRVRDLRLVLSSIILTERGFKIL